MAYLQSVVCKARSIERPVSPRTSARLSIALSGVSPMDENDKARPLDLQDRMRELYAAVESQQRYLFQVLGQSVDLLSASEKQADHLVVAFEHAAAGVAPEWAKAEVLVRRAEALHHRAERARELRNGIVAAVAALAVITEESAAICLGLDTGREEAIDWIYGERLVQPLTAKS